MSIVTRKGDSGETSLLYNRRVSKTNARVAACGDLDELSSALGLARSLCALTDVRESLLAIQKDLVAIMGSLAVAPEDHQQYLADTRFRKPSPAMLDRIDAAVEKIEQSGPQCNDWSFPGESPASAALEISRAVCRRAERTAVELAETGQALDPVLLKYLNRISDYLWLLARQADRTNSAP